jgi:hypothetical protein
LTKRAKEFHIPLQVPTKLKESPFEAQVFTNTKVKCEKCEISINRKSLTRHRRRIHSQTNIETTKTIDTMMDVLIKDVLVDSSGLSVFPTAEPVPLLLPNVSDIALDDLKFEA